MTRMGSAPQVHRVTVASFGTPTTLGYALDSLLGAGMVVSDLCLACAPATVSHISDTFAGRPVWHHRYGPLVTNLAPAFAFGEGTSAVATADRLLTRIKSPQLPLSATVDMACVVPAHLRNDLLDRLRGGSTLLLANAASHAQHTACQRIALAHSADRVQGHQFTWPLKLSSP